MRSLLIIPLIAAASTARAENTPYSSQVDMRMVDASCRTRAEIPYHPRIPGPNSDAAISTANCMVTARTRALVVTPTVASVAALDDAVAPSMAILDRVIDTGDAEHRLIAQYAKLDIFQGNTERLLAALPHLSPQMGTAEVADHARLVRLSDSLTQAWRQRALESRREIARLASRNPQLVDRNEVLAYMVAHSRIVEAAGVAVR